MRRTTLSRNHYFVFGILVGLALSFYIPQDIWELVQQEECPQEAAEQSLIEKFGQDFEPHLNLINKPLAAKKTVKNVNRPRYYSSELGIREKIFVGVMTSQDNINTLATAINRTTAHLVNKMKFFINADNVKANYKLKNIVGFTDTRESLRPFHVIKYIADTYLDDYDYFLIIRDDVYVDARKLKAMVYHMSVTFDVYMGTRSDGGFVSYGGGPVDETNLNGQGGHANANGNGNGNGNGDNAGADGANVGGNDDFRMLSDRNYCDLSAGILLSSSVMRKMRNNLDWCVRNGITNVHGVNIGRCVKYSSKLSGCQESFQGVRQQAFALKSSTKLFKDLNVLAKDEAFRNATTVYPVTSTDDFYRLHAYFSRHHLDVLQQKGTDLERKSYGIANGSISNNILEIRWPLGVPVGSAPETRHDIITWQLINRTHIFLPNAENVVAPLSRIDALDFEKVLRVTVDYAKSKYPDLEFSSLHTAYRKFDATRGMDYQLHLSFRDVKRSSKKLVTKSFELVKPLGRVEVIPSPYVTESTRIAIMVPTFEHQLNEANDFIMQYERICMRNQDNTFLLMIFLYRYDSPSKGESDPFRALKTFALELSTKYKTDGSRIAWVSIRLPPTLSDPALPEELMQNSLYGRNEILSVAVTDLALPKIGLDSLVLMASTSISFKGDFLNRVRMNTIQGFQVYSPIGFMAYPCELAHFCRECETCDVSQASGYFDKWNYDVISFYSRDYVQARKVVDSILPIIRTDNDIEQLLSRSDKSINNILDMFVSSQLSLHILRGVEPNLRYGHAIRNYFKTSKDIPKCVEHVNGINELGGGNNNNNNNNNNNINNYSNEIPLRYDNFHREDSLSSWSRSRSLSNHKCVHLASRKQIGDAIIRYEDKSIIQK